MWRIAISESAFICGCMAGYSALLLFLGRRSNISPPGRLQSCTNKRIVICADYIRSNGSGPADGHERPTPNELIGGRDELRCL
jgi:hypothetical protein